MQILLGAHETIVRINSKNINIEYIQHFITINFLNRSIENQTIFIPSVSEDSFQRSFLLKWLYALYTKRTNMHSDKLQESLIRRQKKAIRITLPNEIIHNLTWKVFDRDTVCVSIVPSSFRIALNIKHYFKKRLNLNETFIKITLNSQEEKEHFYELLCSEDIINTPHQHLYNEKKINDFLSYEKPIITKEDEIIKSAHQTLGSSPRDDFKTLKKHYKKLAMDFHPDKANRLDSDEIRFYTQKFQNILEAYGILSLRAAI